MSGLERLWAGWRSPYLDEATATATAAGGDGGDGADQGCVFCRILASPEPGEETQLIWRNDDCAVIVNRYPYTSGHVMVMPVRHVADLEALDEREAPAVWSAVADAVRALKSAYRPDGLNVGANLGRAAGAGVPGHFHVHVLPRWNADTNFMTTVAEARVVPEPLPATWAKVRAAWPRHD